MALRTLIWPGLHPLPPIIWQGLDCHLFWERLHQAPGFSQLEEVIIPRACFGRHLKFWSPHSRLRLFNLSLTMTWVSFFCCAYKLADIPDHVLDVRANNFFWMQITLGLVRLSSPLRHNVIFNISSGSDWHQPLEFRLHVRGSWRVWLVLWRFLHRWGPLQTLLLGHLPIYE